MRIGREAFTNVNTKPGDRYAKTENKYKLAGCDHFALPTMNVELMTAFIEEVLGGELYSRHGFDEVDQSMGRKKHIFYRVGDVLMQCAEPQDGRLKIGKEDLNGWPHWAFGTTAQGLDENYERLKSIGIPIFGPVRHRGGGAVSIYFAGPEGHKLEIVTNEPYPEEKAPVAGSPGVGHTDWSKLWHEWPNI